MDNDSALNEAFSHWQNVGYSVQTAMILALVRHAKNPGRPEHSDKFTMTYLGLSHYQRWQTNLRYEDLV